VLTAFLLLVVAACSSGSHADESPGGGDDGGAPDALSPDSGGGDGGASDGQGGDGSAPPKDVTCQTLAPLASGTCSVAAGDASRLLVGTILAPGVIYRGGQVLVDGTGAIVAVGCKADCDADPTCSAKAATATVITCPKGVVSPGLINAHDHITYTQNAPHTGGTERYEERNDWREGLNGHTKIPAPGGASADQQSWGELRFVMGGATSIVGSGGEAGLVRNLDKSALEEGLAQTAVDFDVFPLGDSDGVEISSR
jgi:hypothetical protein